MGTWSWAGLTGPRPEHPLGRQGASAQSLPPADVEKGCNSARGDPPEAGWAGARVGATPARLRSHHLLSPGWRCAKADFQHTWALVTTNTTRL